MVTDTMSWKELSAEIGNDFKESHIEERWIVMVKVNMRKYRPAMLAGKTKIYKPVAIKSKRGNTFYATTVAQKSAFNKTSVLDYYYAMPLFYHNHLWTAIMALGRKGESICTFFSNHLFCRYDERFNHREETHETFVQRIIEFFFRNCRTCAMERTNPKTGKKEFFSVNEDGILLGDLIDGVMIFRTYIRFDMMHEDQWESYRELVDDYNKAMEAGRR